MHGFCYPIDGKMQRHDISSPLCIHYMHCTRCVLLLNIIHDPHVWKRECHYVTPGDRVLSYYTWSLNIINSKWTITVKIEQTSEG